MNFLLLDLVYEIFFQKICIWFCCCFSGACSFIFLLDIYGLLVEVWWLKKENKRSVWDDSLLRFFSPLKKISNRQNDFLKNSYSGFILHLKVWNFRLPRKLRWPKIGGIEITWENGVGSEIGFTFIFKSAGRILHWVFCLLQWFILEDL